MGYTLTDKIFGFFGVDAKVQDTYKDGSNKGIWERYNESLGQDYDENLMPLVDNFVDNLINPDLLLTKFLPLMEQNIGNPVFVSSSETIRRKLIKFNNALMDIKSTALSYQVFLGLLGFKNVVITIVDTDSGFDSPETHDASMRRFDRSKLTCRHYTVEMDSGSVPSDATKAIVDNIIEYLNPIDGEIDEVIYHVAGRHFDHTFSRKFE